MNAKTTSTLMLFSIFCNIILIITLIFFGYKNIIRKNYLPMNCTSTFHINKGVENNLTGTVNVVLHITEDGNIAVNEYGNLKYKEEEFIIDRTGHMTMSKSSENGFHKVIKGNFVANPNDTTPPVLIEKLTSSQSVLFYKIHKLDDATWRISDLQKTIFICHA